MADTPDMPAQKGFLRNAWDSASNFTASVAKYLAPGPMLLAFLVVVPGGFWLAHPGSGFWEGFLSFYSPMLDGDKWAAGISGWWEKGIKGGFNTVAELVTGIGPIGADTAITPDISNLIPIPGK